MTSDTGPLSSISLQDLARQLGLEPPDLDLEITGVNSIEEAGSGDLTFLASERHSAKLQSSKAGAVLIGQEHEGETPMPALRTARPRLAFARVAALFHREAPRAEGFHVTAVVPPSCTLGPGVSIGAYTVLGENVRIGAGSIVREHCSIYDDVTLGADCEIHSHVAIRQGVTLGDRVLVQNGVVLGSDGFGFEPTEDGRFHKVPQIGTVRIGDDVEVQANSCVDRAAVGATVVGRGTKIDNLAQIAHGCTLGEDTIICAQVGLSGSVHLGDHVLLGGQVGFADHIRVGDGAQVAAQSGVIQDLEGGKRYGGTPAVALGDALRYSLLLVRLPDIVRRVGKLEREMERRRGED